MKILFAFIILATSAHAQVVIMGHNRVVAMPASNCGSYSKCYSMVIASGRVTATQTNFAVYSVGNADARTTANGGSVTNSNGFDINFFPSSTGCSGTKRDWELVSGTYNAVTGSGEWHVLMPSIATTGTAMGQMCIGNAAVTTDQSNRTAVWPPTYKAVYHLYDGTTLSATDSTSNAANGTNTSMTAGTGQMDGAAVGAGSGGVGNPSWIDTGIAPASLLNNLTVSFWAYANAGNNPQSPFGSNESSISGTDREALSVFDNTGPMYWVRVRTTADVTVSGGTFSTTTWHYVVVTYDGSTVTLYADGASVSTGAQTGNLYSDPQNFLIGARGKDTTGGGGVYAWNGNLDEVRISNSAYSASKIAAEYANQSAPTTFVTYTAQ